MVKILLIGKHGQLGWELQRTCLTLGELTAVDFPEIDLSKTNDLRDLIRTHKPNLVLNAAAYTNVDKAESEPDLARKINAIAPAVIAEEINKLRGVFIHYSTDYVFDGKKGLPYIDTDIPNPLNVYGSTKLEGEQLVQGVDGASLIFRTSWVYSLRQGGFVTKVLQWARQQEILRIVEDQVGSPTWARILAESTAQVIAQGRNEIADYIQEKGGLYHLAGSGHTSRYEWAKSILELDPKKEEQLVKQLLTAKSDDFPTPAVRPLNTGLDCSVFERIFNLKLPSWQKALKIALQ
ncbi:MAG: dTDP-4-dehydrorhamnose reductase [Candidatus Electryonea clarkiae]|nr:dTDP-4-dehydrorhamnose reductase [Candidatus Electryonea clarkiae]